MVRHVIASLMCVTLCSGAWAVEIQNGNSVVISDAKPVTQDLIAAGSDVSVRPAVQGDVTAAGQSVSIAGPVSESIFAAGQSVTVTGKTRNDVRIAGSEVALAAPVGDTAYVAGSTVRILNTATIGSDLLAAGNQISIFGSVGKDARLAGNQITIGGPINGNVYARGNQIRLLAGARIRGNLYYESANAAQIDPGAVVQGQTLRTLPPRERKHPMFWSGLAWWLLWLAAAILFGVVFLWLFPARTQLAADVARRSVGASIVAGFVALIVTPFVAFIAMITLVGLPLGIALLIAYFILLYAAKVFVGLSLGQWALQKGGVSGGAGAPIVALILGLFVISLITRIPIIGPLISFFVLIIGLGGFLLSWWRERKAQEVAPAQT